MYKSGPQRLVDSAREDAAEEGEGAGEEGKGFPVDDLFSTPILQPEADEKDDEDEDEDEEDDDEEEEACCWRVPPPIPSCME